MTPNWGEDLKTRAIGERNIRRQFYCCCNHSLKKVWYLSIINIFQVDRMGGRPMHVSEADALAFFLRSFSSNQATNKFQSSNHWGAGNRTSEVCECLAAAKFAVVPLHMDRPNTLIRVHFELENSNSILLKQTSCSFPKGSTSLLLPYFPETINHPSICLLSWPSFHLRPANRVLISKVLGYKQYFGREYDEQLLLGSKT